MLVDLFLDSCVIIASAYGPEIDRASDDCTAVINSAMPLFTSLFVKDELGRVTKRRGKLYQDLLAWMAGGGLVGSFPRVKTEVNDDRHLDDVAKAVRTLGQKDVLEFVRLLGYRLGLGVEETLRMLAAPPIGLAHDRELHDRLLAKSIHWSDARITAQYFAWGRYRSLSWFLTKDRRGVISMREDILQDVEVVYALSSRNVDLRTPKEARRELGV